MEVLRGQAKVIRSSKKRKGLDMSPSVMVAVAGMAAFAISAAKHLPTPDISALKASFQSTEASPTTASISDADALKELRRHNDLLELKLAPHLKKKDAVVEPAQLGVAKNSLEPSQPSEVRLADGRIFRPSSGGAPAVILPAGSSTATAGGRAPASLDSTTQNLNDSQSTESAQ